MLAGRLTLREIDEITGLRTYVCSTVTVPVMILFFMTSEAAAEYAACMDLLLIDTLPGEGATHGNA